MHLLCQMERHQVAGGGLWNDGHFFSFCARCGCDLVRRTPAARWRRVRAPMKVVWRARRPFDMPWAPGEPPPLPDAAVPIAPEWRTTIARGTARHAETGHWMEPLDLPPPAPVFLRIRANPG